ncbi:unnamed protein product [Urochloa humidicola]
MAVKASLLAFFTAPFLLAIPVAMSSKRQGFRVTMIRTETTINYTRAAHSSRQRLSILSARLNAAAGSASTQTPLQYDRGGGAYNMEFSIGTPPLKLLAQADTGSDLIWAKCGACASCSPQGSPSYYPDMSSSFSKLPCSSSLCSALGSDGACGESGAEWDYRYAYGSSTDTHHYTQGFLGSETFTLGGDAVPGIGFGCTTMSEGGFGTGSGLVGLGRGSLSLVRQLQVGSFSYCLPSDPSKASPLVFGSDALTGTDVQSTPLLQTQDTFYTVNLQGISIGSVTTAGAGGVVFDSGTTLTFLAEPAYSAAKKEILSQTALPQADHSSEGYEACFVASDTQISGAAPKMVLHFDGADMDLLMDNYFRDMGDGSVCWVVQSSGGTMSIIGNIMQMDYNIRHDIDNFVLSFQPADCDAV